MRSRLSSVIVACIVLGTCSVLAQGLAPSTAIAVYTYSERDEWIVSRGLVIDDGKSVTIVGATSSYASALHLIQSVRRSTSSSIQRVILDSSRPGTSGGIAAFEDSGIDIWASRRVERGLKQVFPYYAADRGDPNGNILRAANTHVATFDDRTSFSTSRPGVIEVVDLPGGCNANGNSVLRVPTNSGPIAYVGSLVQVQHHPLLSGPIVEGLSRVDLVRWRRCIQALRDAGQFQSQWYTDEGPQGPGDAKAIAFMEYLQFVSERVQQLFAERVSARQDFSLALLSGYARELAREVMRRFPERRAEEADLQRALTEVIYSEMLTRTESGTLGPKS
jgi:hypothetical protein